MPILTAEEIQTWSKDQVDKELRDRLADVEAIRERNGGTLVGVKGDDADRVREHLQSTNALGTRRDEINETHAQQADAEETFSKLGDYLNKPAAGHPGHPNGNGNGNQQQPLKGPQDVGALFIASEALKAYQEHGVMNKPVVVPTGSVFGGGYTGTGEVPRTGAALFDSTGFGTRPDYRDDMLVSTLYQRNNIGPLMPQGSTDSDTIIYPVETVTATGAAEVAESSSKPEAQLSFADTTEPVQTIAVLLPITNKALRNHPFLRSYLNARLRLFVQNREDYQLLNGNGTSPNIKGILNRSGINTATSYSIGGSNPDQALIDAVFHASMRVRDAFLEPDAAVMKPATWEIAALAKDGQRNYLLGSEITGYAADGPNPRLWGLKVVINTNMPAQATNNKPVLVGAFGTGAAMVVRRDGINLAISDSHGTYFAENKVMLRCEEEVALCVFRPAGFAAVTSAA